MDYSESTGMLGAIAGVGLFIYFLIIAFFIIVAWKINTKAGKPGWACIVPIYNMIVTLEIVGKPIWWILLLIFPLTAPIFAIWITNLLSKSFGKGVGFTLGLLFLPIIFYPILAFGSAEYQGPAGAAPAVAVA